jgi:hypothetical protein
MITKPKYGRLPKEIIEAHKKAWIKLSPICCDAIEKYKQQLDWALKKRPSSTLKEMSEIIWESKKDFYISEGNICLLCWITKIKNSNIWNDRKYYFDLENDIKFLWNNKYQISIEGTKYWLPGVLNNPDLNIILEYHPENWSINYYDWTHKGTIIINKSNLINPLTVYRDKVAKTKINFKAQNKDFELIIDIPFENKSVNNMENNSQEQAA